MAKLARIALTEAEQRELDALMAQKLDLSAEELNLLETNLLVDPKDNSITIQFAFKGGLELDNRHRAAMLRLAGVAVPDNWDEGDDRDG